LGVLVLTMNVSPILEDWKKSSIADAIISTTEGKPAFVSVTAAVSHVGPELQYMFKYVCSTCGKNCTSDQAIACLDTLCKSHQSRSFSPKLVCSPYLSLCDYSGSIERVNVPNDAFLALLGLDSAEQLRETTFDDYKSMVLSKLVWRRLHVALKTRRDVHGNVSGYASHVTFPKSFSADVAWLKSQSQIKK
jgi:hypothetical protein